MTIRYTKTEHPDHSLTKFRTASMTTSVELARIFERVQTRLEKSASSYNAISTLLSRRADVETKFAQLLKEVIPENYDKTDVILSALVEEFISEMNAHLTLAQDMRSQVVTPTQQQGLTFRDKQKSILSIGKKEVSVIQKAVKDVETAAHEVEAQKAKLGTIPGNKVDAHNQKIQKAAAEHQRRKQIEIQVITTIQSTSIPTVHNDFSELDSQRASKIQTGATTFENLKKSANELINQGILLFQGKMADYDGRKISLRHVGKVFDTAVAETQAESEQESGVIAVADFRSLDPHDLAFERGDQIQVLVQHESGWWEGVCNEQRGLFPSTFVMRPGEVDTTTDQIGAVFMAIRDFVTTRGSEIALLCGDFVYVDFITKGRCSGTNLRNGKRGFFPLDAVEQRLKTENTVSQKIQVTKD